MAELLQIELHEPREQGATTIPVRPSLSSYTAAIGSALRPLIPTELLTIIILARAEELFCLMDFSLVEHNEETTAADSAALRKKTEQEIQKEDEKFCVKAVVKDRRSPNRLRTLCRSEEELKNVKSAAQILMTDKSFKVLRLNTQEKRETMHSLMNGGEFESFGAALISELNAQRNQDGVVISSPMAHRNWTKMKPSQINGEGWPLEA